MSQSTKRQREPKFKCEQRTICDLKSKKRLNMKIAQDFCRSNELNGCLWWQQKEIHKHINENTYVRSLVKTDRHTTYTKMNCSRFWLSEFYFWRERFLLSVLNAETFDCYIRRMESSLKSKEWICLYEKFCDSPNWMYYKCIKAKHLQTEIHKKCDIFYACLNSWFDWNDCVKFHMNYGYGHFELQINEFRIP